MLTLLVFSYWLMYRAFNKKMRLCVCRGDKREHCCIDPNKVNLFSTLDDIDGILSRLELRRNGEIDRSNTNSQSVSKWNKTKDCELYLILLYDNDGKRIQEHEIVAPPNKTTHVFPEAVADMRVLSLFETCSKHGFVDIVEAHYFIKPYKFVIDLSVVKKSPIRRSSIRFGFLCHNSYKQIKRVAAKQIVVEIANTSDENVSVEKSSNIDEAKKQIGLTLEAGGEYNMKYLASTIIKENKDIWIAMELCIRTFDVLIEKQLGSEWLIDDDKMKICFRQILQGLIHLHSKGIVHGEMILENILLSLDGEVLKIGEYDHVKQIQLGTLGEATRANDIEMTGRMFFKCLKRDSKWNTKELDRLASRHNLSPWEIELKKLANELGGDVNSYLAAYLIIYIVLEKPTAEEVLKHPYFWSEYKMLSFVTRMDAGFDKNSQSEDFKLMKTKFQNYFKIFSDLPQKQKLNWHDGLQNIPENLFGKELKSEMRRTLSLCHKYSNMPKYNSSDITRFLRFIRNMQLHYHEDLTEYKEERVKKFESTSHVWKCVNSMHPGMICLLHRVVWQQGCSLPTSLPDDIKIFFEKSKSVGTLGLGKENEMNYYSS